MCKLLNIPRANYYYDLNKVTKPKRYNFEDEIIRVFEEAESRYGARRIRKQLRLEGIIISRRKIRQVMIKNALVSLYTVKQYKPEKSSSNQEKIENELDRNFDNDTANDVVVSDLTYVNVAGSWHYICILIDLYNREIIGYSAGSRKTANLVYEAFMNADIKLGNIRLFHTDRGKEFDNKVISQMLETFDIKRSLSKPGCPYDNAVAEATFKTFKTEFCHKRFESSDQLKMELFRYVNWYNKDRLHSSLGYMSPINYRNSNVYSKTV